jgi:UDP-3-O-[3-hydroxymyristoyl] N-acetylglucosamine deacetylase
MSSNESYYMQHTLATSFSCLGMGLHSGYVVTMIVMPAAANTGYTFVRRDIDNCFNEVKAHWHNVYDAKLGTNLRNDQGVRVLSVEHLLAALSTQGIDNARILIDGPEVPSMDGSARTFSDLILSVGRVQQNAQRKVLLVKKTVQVREGERSLSVQPSPLLWMDLEVNAPHAKLGSRRISTPVTELLFVKKLSGARNFIDADHLEAYKELGYFQGASQNNLLILQQDEILNKGKLRYKDEIARHKAVDLLGDMVLADAPVMGHFIGRSADHSLHHLLMLELMCDPSSYVITTLKELEDDWLGLTKDTDPKNRRVMG